VILRQTRELGDPSAKASIRSELSLTHRHAGRVFTRGDVKTLLYCSTVAFIGQNAVNLPCID
jgi:hypothetical protein